MARKPTKKNARLNCEARARKACHDRGACERCGRTDQLEWAHIIKRRFTWTRTREDNCWALCHWCHAIVDRHASQFYDLVHQTIGVEKLLELEELSHKDGKSFDWYAELERWKALQAEETVHD